MLMRIIRFRIILVYLLWISYALVNAQSNEYIGHIGSEDGLQSQLCSHIVEDDHGNLWIGSFQDVQKYNGYSVTVFPLKKRKGDRSDNIADVCKDNLGNIWVIQGYGYTVDSIKCWNIFLKNSNINVIDPLTDSVVGIAEYFGQELFDVNSIVKVFVSDGVIYLGLKSNDIYRFTGELEHYSKVDDLKSILTITDQGEIVSYEKGELLFKDSQGNFLHGLGENEMIEYEGIYPSKSGKIFLLKELDDLLTVVEYNKHQYKTVIQLNKSLFNDHGLEYFKVESYSDDQFWINGKLFYKDEHGEYAQRKFQRSTMVNEYISNEMDLGYAATNLGVYVYSNKKKLVKKLSNDEQRMNSVRGVFINKDLRAYKVYDHEIIESGSERYNLDFLKGKDLGYLAYSHYLDPINEDHLWTVGLVPKFVRRIDFKNKKLETFDVYPGRPELMNSILRSSVTSNLYVSSENGVYTFDEEKNIFFRMELACVSDPRIVTNHLIEKNSEIWIASAEGVIRYDETSRTSKLEKIFPSDAYTIQFLHEDLVQPSVVWLGTQRGGLVKWYTDLDSIVVYDTNNGLSNNDVHAIIEDNSERLWISTNRYLNCLDKKSNRISVYTEQDGLSHSEYNKHGYFYDKSNNLIYFGGLDGYNYFCPDSISTTSLNRIEVRLIEATKTTNEGKVKDVFYELNNTSHLDILEEDISFELEMSTNYLFDSENIQYSYRIPALSSQWKTQSSNSLHLNKLPYGKYKLELISDLNKPAFTSKIHTISLHIIKPFWKTWLFVIASIFALAYILWLMVLRYNRNIKARNLKLEETVQLRTQELREVINIKNKIFTILAHDLRNPISGLSNLSDKIKFLVKKNRIKDLDLIAEETEGRVHALNDNLNNVLIWAMSENNFLKLTSRKLSLLIELDKIVKLYSHEIDKKNIEVIINVKENDEVYLDVSIFQTILRNFINNAIKFSHLNGKITLGISFESDREIELEIRDEGIGFDTDQEDDSALNNEIRRVGKGSGIGLMISKELIEKSGMSLAITSLENKGTTIRLLMPKPLANHR